jgi:hypothetical protein
MRSRLDIAALQEIRRVIARKKASPNPRIYFFERAPSIMAAMIMSRMIWSNDAEPLSPHPLLRRSARHASAAPGT